MILQALTRYYDILRNDPQSGISLPGYSVANVSFALNISRQGELLSIIPLFEEVTRGKKTREIPLRKIVPKQVKKSSNILANFLCDNSAYVLGLSAKDEEKPDYAVERHKAFMERNIEILRKADCEAAQAVIAFLDEYDPRVGRENHLIARHLEEILKGGNLVFQVDNHFVHENALVQQVWEDYYNSQEGAYIGQCLVTGEEAPIARLHASLKGVIDAQSSGASIVSFNERAYESYNRTKEQGLNSPVSEKAAFAYTTALNYLLSRENENSKFTIGDTTIVYWAESEKKEYARVFMNLCLPTEEEPQPGEDDARLSRGKKAEQDIRKVAGKVQRGQALDANALLENLDGKTTFYVLGLAPNASRISVRFFHRDPFEKLVQKILVHYQDLEIMREFEDQQAYIPIWQIERETVSRNARDKKASPLLGGALFRSILNNTPYPAALYYAILNRIRADHEINYVRTAVVKAYLKRKYRNQSINSIKEVLTMSLNEKSTNPAYLLGRLFAVLEKAQKDAVPNLNATIKDRYFTSACATPASTFPVLLRLAQHHISKAEYGYVSDNMIEKIMNLLDLEENPIPAHLTLDEQGIFILGYYHQRAAFYISKASASVSESIEIENQVN